ncbi:amidohydrolase [Meredithblackwellia eburnea MCA 4105]
MPSCLSPLFARFSSSSSRSDSHEQTRATARRSQTPSSIPETTPRSDEKSGHHHHHHQSHQYADTCCTQTFVSPPTYSPARAVPLPLSEDEIATLEGAIQGLDAELRKLSLKIHDNPEIAWKEVATHDALCDFMESHGFKVTRHAYGLDTAWEATWENGAGGPVVGFNSEMDALPGIGHACGHNLIAIAGVAAALGVAAGLKKYDIAGKVILLGVPAEEQDGGKINLLKAGAYAEMDICQMLHPAPYNAIGSSLAVAEVVVEYTGHTAHAAGAPWEAVNAQDAAVLAYNNISALRQQIHPSHRVHGIIINENWVQNVIPGSSKVIFGARCPTLAELEVLKVRVEKCFQAAGIATGCDYSHDWVMAYSDLRNNQSLADVYTDFMTERYKAQFPVELSLGGSTDFGNVSYELPALHPAFQIPCGVGEGNHTVGFTAAAATKEAHQLTLDAAKGISVSSWKFITDKEYASTVKKEFKKMKDSL